jgi:ectoine hydroxylase-related dioxygenase (phytanoyl-CoA dioxygenase family)
MPTSESWDLHNHVARLNRDGYTIIPDLLDAEGLDQFRTALAPYLGSHLGRNPFEGHRTERVYTLVARGRIFESITADPRVMALIGAFLRPGFLLSASHAINILPGEQAQDLHSDDSFYPLPRPRPPIGISVIGAIDDFTEENGATVVYRGSHLWGRESAALKSDLAAGRQSDLTGVARRLTMPAGAAAVFLGTLIHGAGANRSAGPRLAFTSQYCEPWARTQENFYLAVPKARVRAMSPTLRTLLGYDVMPPFMGQVTASHPSKSLAEGWVAPVERDGVVIS